MLYNISDKRIKSDEVSLTANTTAITTMTSAWVSWSPTLTWTTATPTGVSTKAYYKVIGKLVYFRISITATDGKGATGLTIPLPSGYLPKNNGLNSPVANRTVVGTTFSYKDLVIRDDGTHNDIYYNSMGTATSASAFAMQAEGFYEIA